MRVTEAELYGSLKLPQHQQPLVTAALLPSRGCCSTLKLGRLKKDQTIAEEPATLPTACKRNWVALWLDGSPSARRGRRRGRPRTKGKAEEEQNRNERGVQKKKKRKKDGGDGSETAVGELMTEEATTKRRNARAGVRGR